MSAQTRKKVIVYTVVNLSVIMLLVLYIGLAVNAFFSAQGGFTLQNFRFFWERLKIKTYHIDTIWPYLKNTIIFSAAVTILVLMISLTAAYSISRLNFRGKKLFLNSLFTLEAFPAVSLLISIYYVLNFSGLINTIYGAIIVKVALMCPSSVYLLKGFFDDVPWDAEWSALVDGCSRFEAFYKIVLSYVKPGIASVATLTLISAWSEYIIPASYIYQKDFQTLSIYLKSAMGESNNSGSDIGVVSAIALFYLLPVIIYFIVTQISLMKKNQGGTKRV